MAEAAAWPRRLFSPSDLLLLIGSPKIDRRSAEEIQDEEGTRNAEEEENRE